MTWKRFDGKQRPDEPTLRLRLLELAMPSSHLLALLHISKHTLQQQEVEVILFLAALPTC